MRKVFKLRNVSFSAARGFLMVASASVVLAWVLWLKPGMTCRNRSLCAVRYSVQWSLQGVLQLKKALMSLNLRGEPLYSQHFCLLRSIICYFFKHQELVVWMWWKGLLEMQDAVWYSISTDAACSLVNISFGATSDLSSFGVSKPIECPQLCQCNSVHSCRETFWIKFRFHSLFAIHLHEFVVGGDWATLMLEKVLVKQWLQ